MQDLTRPYDDLVMTTNVSFVPIKMHILKFFVSFDIVTSL